MNHQYFPEYQNIKERLENLVIYAENKYFGDLDLEMEGLYFNIQEQLDLLLEKLSEAGFNDSEDLDSELNMLILRASYILITNQ